MKFNPEKLKLPLLILFGILVVAFIARAEDSYVVTLDPLTVNAFPAIPLSLNINLNGAMATNLYARHLGISEKGIRNDGAFVVLPPKSPNPKMDLFILLDRSGNAKPYEALIKGNLKSLVRALKASTDLQVFINSFGNNDTLNDGATTLVFTEQFETAVDSILFDEPVTSGARNKAQGFNRLSAIATHSQARPDADKIALVVTASPFSEDSLTSVTPEMVAHELGAQNFTLITTGLPLKRLSSPHTQNSEDQSLSHILPGGYLGSFSTDLTLLSDLLAKRRADRTSVLYLSTLQPDEAANQTVELSIDGSPVMHFNYPSIDPTQPQLIHTPLAETSLGDTLNLSAQVDNGHQMVNQVLAQYFDNKGIRHRISLPRNPRTTLGTIDFSANLPADLLPPDHVVYQFSTHTPYQTIESPIFAIPVLALDRGISLKGTLVNNKEILWSWSGPTVDMGTSYELYDGDGDKLITTTTDRHFTIPVNDCNKYQIVKLRVFIKPGAAHPRAGQWSLFSRAGEEYLGPTGTPTEQEGIEKLVQCLDPKTIASFKDLVSSETIYKATKPLNLVKTLYYATAIYDRRLQSAIDLDEYTLFYSLLGILGPNDMTQYSSPDVQIPYSMLYKTITGINQTADFTGAFKEARNKRARQIFGDSTI